MAEHSPVSSSFLPSDALKKMDGDDILLNIYDNVHEELRVKTKLLDREKEKVNRQIKHLLVGMNHPNIPFLCLNMS